jgi:hypothetical protein
MNGCTVLYPFWQIRRKGRLSSCKNYPVIVLINKITYEFHSSLISNIIPIARVRTKMALIVTVAIHLDVSDICHITEFLLVEEY